MGFLNEFESYDAVATPESRALFLGGSPIAKEVLRTGLLLCRFVPRAWADTHVCPWWILVDPVSMSNGSVAPGIGEFLLTSGCRLLPTRELYQPAGVQLTCVERYSRFHMVRLTQPVYGFLGPTVPQRPEPCGGASPLRGGEFRVWIPGLTKAMLLQVPPPHSFWISYEELAQIEQGAATTWDEPPSDAGE